MCLIVFAWQVVPGSPLITAANRDEFYARPSVPASWWEDRPYIYAGRDLQDGGIWIGITHSDRFVPPSPVCEGRLRGAAMRRRAADSSPTSSAAH